LSTAYNLFSIHQKPGHEKETSLRVFDEADALGACRLLTMLHRVLVKSRFSDKFKDKFKIVA